MSNTINNSSDSDIHWQPTASITNLKQRARLFAHIRQFFAQRNVLEVDTATLAGAGVTDAHLANFVTHWHSPESSNSQVLFLQTSPEYAMKRLLAAGSGCIYQLGKAFRNEEAGRFHNAEFTMLEWYRIDFDIWRLMDEIEALLNITANAPTAKKMSYQQAFQHYLRIDPLAIGLADLKVECNKRGYDNLTRDEQHKDTLLQLLFTHDVETQFPKECPIFIHDFPASQAALAKLNPRDPRTALRFELYWQGVELANGFDELTDATEQLQRFQNDNEYRQQLNLAPANIDERFLAALASGLPNCAGVALGVDRLLMIILQAKHIKEVMPFPTEQA